MVQIVSIRMFTTVFQEFLIFAYLPEILIAQRARQKIHEHLPDPIRVDTASDKISINIRAQLIFMNMMIIRSIAKESILPS